MHVDLEETPDALIVRPRFRRLDAASSIKFRDQVTPRLGQQRLVVIAMGAIDFMDSSGVGALVQLLKKLPAGSVVRLAELAAPLKKVLQLTRLDKVLPSFASVEEAVA
jgi:anti-sigma B factor antagonist